MNGLFTRMDSPIVRMATSTAPVRAGFFAAGLMVAGIAIVQTFSTVVAWVVAIVI